MYYQIRAQLWGGVDEFKFRTSEKDEADEVFAERVGWIVRTARDRSILVDKIRLIKPSPHGFGRDDRGFIRGFQWTLPNLVYIAYAVLEWRAG